MKARPQPAPHADAMKAGTPATTPKTARWFAALFGAFLGLALLKFGNPAIMERFVSSPADPYEFVLSTPWPIRWGLSIFAIVCLAGLPMLRNPRSAPAWLLALPALWFVWQLLAAAHTVDRYLTSLTLFHFAATTACFYVGYFALGRLSVPRVFWLGIGAAFALMLFAGFAQHFGGLEATRRYFWLYLYPQLKEVQPEYLKKISSNRIFGTLFYPNALAGALLLLLPPVLAFLWSLKERFTSGARAFLLCAVGGASLAVLYWSGSKGGWLLMLLLCVIPLFGLPFSRRSKLAVTIGLLGLGLTGFIWKYHAFFEKGATSVGARFDYWRAALQIARSNPIFGTGPGTFSLGYQALRPPQAEPARLVHNDYLQQACDSGLLGFVLYALLIGAVLVVSGRACWTANLLKSINEDPAELLKFATWLGLLGWSLQGLFEFGLYIPALSWTAFAMAGWLLSQPPQTARPAA